MEVKPSEVKIGVTKLLTKNFSELSEYKTEIDINNPWYKLGTQICY